MEERRQPEGLYGNIQMNNYTVMSKETEKLKKIAKAMEDIMGLSDNECDALEAEFRKNNIFK